MQRTQQAAGLIFAAIGGFLALQGLRLGLEGLSGPGAGLFPFLIGVALVIASVVWIFQLQREGARPFPAEFFPDAEGLKRIGVIMLLLVGFAVALRQIGYDLTMFVFLLGAMLYYDREHIIAKLLVALAASFGLHYVFEYILKTPLPYASIAFLRDLGL